MQGTAATAEAAPRPAAPAPVAVSRAETPRKNVAERRQISIFFCDLVGSTGISRGLDPEELRDLILEYRSIVAGAVTALGGSVARYVGDGVLAFFGYPVAHENDAARAVRAGLDIVRQLTTRGDELRRRYGHTLQVRIGIHTGVVVVGDLESGSIFERMSVIGEAPNVAARLQELAQPNRIVVGPLTARLIGGLIPLAPLGPMMLKGITDAIEVFEASIERNPGEIVRPVAVPGIRLHGRAAERATLWNLWQRAAGGEGRIVVIGGEAGIGKSRLLRDFHQRLKDVPHRWYDLVGSPLETGSTFGPVMGSIRRDVGAMGARSPGEVARKVKRILSAALEDIGEVAELVCEYMGLPWDEPSLVEGWSQARKRRRIVEGLTAFVMRQSRDGPIVVAVEDVHWMDASTRELLDALANQSARHPVLLVVTHRPEAEIGWQHLANVTHLRLAPLPAQAVESMIREIADRGRLTGDTMQAIAARADGLPLFIEELTRSVLDREGRASPAGGVPELPATLRDSLMERIDRFPEAKYLLQIASVIGRLFDFRTVRDLCGLDDEVTEEQLQRLVAAGILFQQGFGPGATYSFKHSLIRDAAYDSMLQRHRRGVHERLATLYRQDREGIAAQQPEILAQHFALAEITDQAIAWYLDAGRLAQKRMALREAIGHATTALELCSRLSDRRAEHELQALTLLGSIYQAIKGYASDDAERSYRRALQIAEGLQDDVTLYEALWGMCSCYHTRGPVALAREAGQRLLTTARRLADPLRTGEALRRLGLLSLVSGDLADARSAFGEARRIFEEGDLRRAVLFGTSPYPILLANLAWLETAAGDWAEAERTLDEAESFSLEGDDPYTTAQVLGMTTVIAQLMGDPVRTLETATACAALSRQQLLGYWEIWGEAFAGWAEAMLRRPGGGDRLAAALERYRAGGALQMTFYGSCLLAQARIAEGRLDDARAIVEAPDEHEAQFSYFAPEWLRLKGEVWRLSGDRDPLPYFREAARVAQAQGSAVMELAALQALMTATGAPETREFAQRRISALTQRMGRRSDAAGQPRSA
jgi:class 3 adenylate cyclase/tetratricopeptide (TPR) repeat protein